MTAASGSGELRVFLFAIFWALLVSAVLAFAPLGVCFSLVGGAIGAVYFQHGLARLRGRVNPLSAAERMFFLLMVTILLAFLAGTISWAFGLRAPQTNSLIEFVSNRPYEEVLLFFVGESKAYFLSLLAAGVCGGGGVLIGFALPSGRLLSDAEFLAKSSPEELDEYL